MLLRISYSRNDFGILDTSLNEGYSSASFKSVVVSTVMSCPLTLFGKEAASQKVYGKLTNNCKQCVNAFVSDEHHCSPSLPLLQEKKLADAAWKEADHGKDQVVVSDVLSSSANDGERVMKCFVVQVPKFLSENKFPSDVLTLKYILLLLRPQTPVFWHQKKSRLCSDGGGRKRVAPRRKTLRSENKCKLMRWPLIWDRTHGLHFQAHTL